MKNWTELLAQTLSPSDKVPSRFKTSKQIAAETKTPVRTVLDKIYKNLDKVEIKKFRVQCGQRVTMTPHYAIKGVKF